MKRIITIGICLVTAAIVYGVADYLKTDRKQLQNMYSDDPVSAVPKTNTGTEPPVLPMKAVVENNAANQAAAASLQAPAFVTSNSMTEKSPGRKRKKLNLKIYSRAIPVEEIKDEVALPVVSAPARTSNVKPANAEKVITDNFKAVKFSSFSRAPLRRKKPVQADSLAAPVTERQR
ncbi:MAG: hypothetical protein JST39_18860 [Bacteroidetes bacterium]|nr:hypothetical protein [Bacteroidota bacterium]